MKPQQQDKTCTRRHKSHSYNSRMRSRFGLKIGLNSRAIKMCNSSQISNTGVNQSNKLNQSNRVTKPCPLIYSLHKRHGQLSGTHFLISSLNFSKVEIILKLLGSILFQTIGPNDLSDCSPLNTVFTLGLKNDFSTLPNRR